MKKLEASVCDYPTHDTSLIGAAGVHYIVSELSLRGLIALPTIRNTAGEDVIVTDKKGTWHANLQVKASRSRVGFWPVGKKYSQWIGPNNYYVFLRFDPKAKSFEVFLESAEAVADAIAKGIVQEKLRGAKEWGPCFYPKGDYDRLINQWERFGQETFS